MATKIRLKRVGGRQKPFYRVVVTDSRAPRDGRVIEEIGHFDPRQDPPVAVMDEARARSWLEKGAQPTERVRRLLVKAGVVS